jgi:hypothetical protein
MKQNNLAPSFRTGTGRIRTTRQNRDVRIPARRHIIEGSSSSLQGHSILGKYHPITLSGM